MNDSTWEIVYSSFAWFISMGFLSDSDLLALI